MFLVRGCWNREFSTPKLNIGSALGAHGLFLAKRLARLPNARKVLGSIPAGTHFTFFYTFPRTNPSLERAVHELRMRNLYLNTRIGCAHVSS